MTTFFPRDADTLARAAMRAIDKGLVEKYAGVIGFLALNPEMACKLRGVNSPKVGTEDYIRAQAVNFCDAREIRTPEKPKTVPDEMVSVILQEYFVVAAKDLAEAQRLHLLSMGAENFVGELLERYLASLLEPRGWIWCSGNVVRSVDFIRPPDSQAYQWRSLQIKNRDNSENSSSSAIREGTPIEKWHRTFSRKAGSNWTAFPDDKSRHLLSEADFKEYVRSYLRKVNQAV